MAEAGEGKASVTVLFVGPMRRPKGVRDETDVPVAGPVTVATLLETLGYRPTERRVLRVLRDDRSLRLDDAVQPGETLTVFLPVGGG